MSDPTQIFTETQILLEGTFSTAWGATCPAAYPNVAFTQPTSSEWVRVNVLEGDSTITSLGASRGERQFGVFILQVFTPKNTGNKRANQLSDTVAAIFRNKQFRSGGLVVECRQPQKKEIGLRDGLWQVNVQIPFEANAVFS